MALLYLDDYFSDPKDITDIITHSNYSTCVPYDGKWISAILKKQYSSGQGDVGIRYTLFQFDALKNGKIVVDAPNPPFGSGVGVTFP